MQQVRRGISIEKQVQKRNVTFANTTSKFDLIIFVVESIEKFREGTFGSPPDSKSLINKTFSFLSKLLYYFIQSRSAIAKNKKKPVEEECHALGK